MADSSKHNAIILSIHPKYAEAILNGSKTVEFRKKNIPRHIHHVVLYATSPVCKVVGYFAVREIVASTPDKAWECFDGNGGITHDVFNKYYADSDLSVALVVKHTWRLMRQLALDLVDGESNPPNSFRYLDEKDLERLVRRKTK